MPELACGKRLLGARASFDPRESVRLSGADAQRSKEQDPAEQAALRTGPANRVDASALRSPRDPQLSCEAP